MARLDSFGRYGEATLLIMTSLADGPKHGYAIMQDVEALHDTRLGPGTLYGAIGRLEQAGLIEALAGEKRRRPYRLTVEGRQVLATTLRDLQQLASTGLSRLAGQ